MGSLKYSFYLQVPHGISLIMCCLYRHHRNLSLACLVIACQYFILFFDIFQQ